MNLLVKNARICDPSAGTDEVRDLCIEQGVIVDTPALPASKYVSMNGDDLIVTPGLVDLHVHFREPGDGRSETTATGSRAAARGGFTHVVTMPNTTPPTDSPDLVRSALAAGQAAGLVNVLPAACVTLGRKGTDLAPLSDLASAGACAFTDDGAAVADASLMKEALAAASALRIPIFQHAVDPDVSREGVIRECQLASERDLPLFDPEAESSIVARDIRLAGETGGHLHIQHISCAKTVELLRSAERSPLRVTSEATPHHLSLCSSDIASDDANYKMNPPLGNPEDREALVGAVMDGTVTCLATDHAPHSMQDKASGFSLGAFGVIGLETAAAVTYDLLVAPGLLPLLRWVALWTTAPAEIIHLAAPSVSAGSPANIAIFKKGSRTITTDDIMSMSTNSPFIGRKTTLNPVVTICNGRETWRAPGY